jgi:2-iminobutanoate/2-iminopropanoate deaminase
MSEIIRIPTRFSYSQAVAAGDYVFLGLHTGQGADFTTQFEDCLRQIKHTLEKFDLPLSNLVKIQVWLKDIRDLPQMEELVRNYFEEGQYPARMTSTTQFIDEERLVMVEGVAFRGK